MSNAATCRRTASTFFILPWTAVGAVQGKGSFTAAGFQANPIGPRWRFSRLADTWSGGGTFLDARHFYADGDGGCDRTVPKICAASGKGSPKRAAPPACALKPAGGHRWTGLATSALLAEPMPTDGWALAQRMRIPTGNELDHYDTKGGKLYRRNSLELELIRDFTDMEFEPIRAMGLRLAGRDRRRRTLAAGGTPWTETHREFHPTRSEGVPAQMARGAFFRRPCCLARFRPLPPPTGWCGACPGSPFWSLRPCSSKGCGVRDCRNAKVAWALSRWTNARSPILVPWAGEPLSINELQRVKVFARPGLAQRRRISIGNSPIARGSV